MSSARPLSEGARAMRRAIRAIKRAQRRWNLEQIALDLSAAGIKDTGYASEVLSDLWEMQRRTLDRRCAHCGIDSIDSNYRADAKYCSDRCRARAHRIKRLTIRNPATHPLQDTASNAETGGASVSSSGRELDA